MKDNRQNILIVDDSPEIVQILTELLKDNHNIIVANNGDEALRLAIVDPLPDLILLDIMMEGKNGIQVCQELKENELAKEIPIIFLTAMTETEEKIKAFASGGVDFITKPFEPEEVFARVGAHLKIRRMQKELIKYNTRLEDEGWQRSRELAEAHVRLKALDGTKHDFLMAISHELRTPANGVLGISQLAIESLEDNEKRNKLEECFLQASNRLLQTIDDALLLAQLQTDEASIALEELDLHLVIHDAIEKSFPFADKKSVKINISKVKSVLISASVQLITNAISTLINAAIKMADPNTTINLQTFEESPKNIMLSIESCGKNLPEETLNHFFDIFSVERSSSLVEELGLSVPVASRIISAMGGSVFIQNNDSSGNEFIVQLCKNGRNKRQSEE